MIKCDIRRKMGLPLQENEAYLYNVLESFQIELNSPINKEVQQQKFNEFIQSIKVFEEMNRKKAKVQSGVKPIINTQPSLSLNGCGPLQATTKLNQLNNNLIDAKKVNEYTDMQQLLRQQHNAIKSLIEIVNQDLRVSKTIRNDMFTEN
jgi:hypothetical protein